MNIKSVETKIYQEIPLVESMGIKIIELTEDHCTLQVPLKLNHNHKGTAFGGSLFAATTTACYALAYSLQETYSLHDWDLVIAHGDINYRRPTTTDFIVRSEVDPGDWQKLVEKLRSEKTKARLSMRAKVYNKADLSQMLCEFYGDFVFISKV